MLQKMLLGLLMFITVLAAVSCSTTSEIYTNTTLGISVEYPSDWQFNEGASDYVTFSDDSSSVIIFLQDSTTNPDPIAALEKISTASVDGGTLESAESPELIQIDDHEAARMRAVAEVSYGIYFGEVESNMPVEIIAISDGNNLVFVSIQQPNRESRRIVESLKFINSD